VRGILQDCDGRVAIVNAARSAPADAWGGIELLDIDELLASPAPGFEPSSPESDDVAWLQYTSGSTGSPKGVRVTHGNLAHNTQRIYDLMGRKPYGGVIWLPPYRTPPQPTAIGKTDVGTILNGTNPLNFSLTPNATPTPSTTPPPS
jgi:acyl-CoA synthetase (AMP-forming)/AMP-acid ligase II